MLYVPHPLIILSTLPLTCVCPFALFCSYHYTKFGMASGERKETVSHK